MKSVSYKELKKAKKALEKQPMPDKFLFMLPDGAIVNEKGERIAERSL